MSSSPVISACGFCADCSVTHSLPVGNSRKYALELFQQLETKKCLAVEVGTPLRGFRGRFGEPSLPSKYSTSHLWGDARGQMFGVLECEDADGNTVVLKAFSGQYNGEWLIDGWVPPILDANKFEKLVDPVDRKIKQLHGKSHDREIFRQRRSLSQQLMKDIQALYNLTNFRGETRSLTDIFPTIGIPTGTGECCAPKLLNHAALNGLTPLGLSEFYFGKESKSGEKQHGVFYPACAEKCQPILGFLLCDKDVECEGSPAPFTPKIASETAGASSVESKRQQAAALQIAFHDNDIVVVCKPSGLLSVPGKGPKNQDCVVSRVKAMFPDCPDHPEVHRLDMDTSGLMLLARNAEAHRELSRQFHDRETQKRYIALLDGIVDGDKGTIKLPFRLDVDNRPVQIYDPVHGKIGITHWKVLGVEKGKTRVEFFPITGRTHQLRVHSASKHGLGVPIVGDRLYGSGTAPGQLTLHASFLSFKHPRTGKKMRFTSEPDF